MARHFKFRQNDNIGAAGAEDELDILRQCFVETPYMEMLSDMNDPKRIILGGTGSGKSALIEQFYARKKDTSVKLNLGDLSFNYLSNAPTLNMLEENGINLNLIYKFIWKHIISLELIKKRYRIIDEKSAKMKIWDKYLTRKNDKTTALEFLRDFSGDFWVNEAENIKHSVSKIDKEIVKEASLNANLDLEFGAPVLSASGLIKRSDSNTALTEEKKTVLSKAVNSIQIQRLSKILDFLDEDAFVDHQNPHFVLIDQLDENWVDRERKYALIKSLIEVAKEFKKVRNVKIIIAVRNDLYSRIIEQSRDEGFQHDKIATLLMRLRWNSDDLTKLINSRINFRFKDRYTKQSVTLNDIKPTSKGKEIDMMKYMLNRSFYRPRHLISFVNFSIDRSNGHSRITKQKLSEAENLYSRERLIAVTDEWGATYPFLEILYEAQRKLGKAQFQASDLLPQISEITSELEKHYASEKITGYAQNAYLDQDKSAEKFLAAMLKILFRIGVVGIKIRPKNNDNDNDNDNDSDNDNDNDSDNDNDIKIGSGRSHVWSFSGSDELRTRSINLNASIKIHPMFWSALSINPVNEENFLKADYF